MNLIVLGAKQADGAFDQWELSDLGNDKVTLENVTYGKFLDIHEKGATTIGGRGGAFKQWKLHETSA